MKGNDMAFKETLEALAAEEAAAATSDESFQASEEQWNEILARRAVLRPEPSEPSDGDGDTLALVAGFVRKHGARASKYLGWPGLATAGTATLMAEDGTFTGPSGLFALLGQVFGLGAP